MRDNFIKQTIAEIAKGVGYRCSNPDCARATVSANAEQNRVITIGVAAHICAAAAGGPRYDPIQTSEMRRGKENGIWLCQTCARLIDVDSAKYPTDLLIQWKHAAQERALRELIGTGGSFPTDEAIRIDQLAASDASADGRLGALFEKVRVAAISDLATYTRARYWGKPQVQLTLKLLNEPESSSFNIDRLPPALDLSPEITLVAPPGTGKTTTLLQLAHHILSGPKVALYFRLGDLSAQSDNLIAALHERVAFKGITRDDITTLAENGRLLLALDGWNELDPVARKRLRLNLDSIRREWPYVRIVVTTRQQALDVPISGPRVTIELLSESQQMAIARAQSDEAGVKIVDEAWRTSGLRDLIATPLYLSALLSVSAGGARPTTKEEVLRLFVEQHERVPEHAEALDITLHGCHGSVLSALANHLNSVAARTMKDAEARQVVAREINDLQQQGQIVGRPEPHSILDVLTGHHTLMRSETGNGPISFQHQLFQEWFSSHKAAEMMRTSAAGDPGARVQLRAAILDQPAWEESVLFAAERLSREHGGSGSVAHAIGLTLGIDPMLAAEMIYRSSSEVWSLISSQVMSFIERWHQPGKVDRALRFMIITGRPEFAPFVWPLASSNDTQLQLPTLRTAPRFRPSVLGADLPEKIVTLKDDTRRHFLALMASESGIDGMDLATELAKSDPNPTIQAEVIQYLCFRGAYRHAAILLAAALDETWSLVVGRAYIGDIGNFDDPAIMARFKSERAKLLTSASGPAQQLQVSLNQPAGEIDREAHIIEAIADPEFPLSESRLLHHVQISAPTAYLRGLRRRIERGLALPAHAQNLLDQLETADDGPIAEAILDLDRNRPGDEKIAVLAGPKLIEALIKRLLKCAQARHINRNDKQSYEDYRKLQSRIGVTRPSSFMAAIQAHASTDDPTLICALSGLISLHGEANDPDSVIDVDVEMRPAIIETLRRWVNAVISSPVATRWHLNEVSNAIGRLGLEDLIPDLKRLLDEDLARRKQAREEYIAARARGQSTTTSDAPMGYGNQYERAFSRIGGDSVAKVVTQYLENTEFGFEAATVLKSIADKHLGILKPKTFRRWPSFDGVAEARKARSSSPTANPANAYADPIFEAIDRLADSKTDREGQRLAIKSARIALAMPHGNQDALIQRVMMLPQPMGAKRELLAAMVLEGQVIDASIIMQGIDEWLEEAAGNAWHKRQNTWEIEPWLELLPHTSRPETVIDGLTKVKDFYTQNWPQRWNGVLTAVAFVPGAEGEALLNKLARVHKDIAGDYEWMTAILNRDTVSATLLYVDLIAEGVFGGDVRGFDVWHVGRQLIQCVQRLPTLRAELKKRYASVPNSSNLRELLEHVFVEIGDQDDLLTMIRKYAELGRAYDYRMDHLVNSIAQVMVPDGSNGFELHPASTGTVRETLFDLLNGQKQEALLAKQCLETIDRRRDELGTVPDDPRHPDVMSEKPWPVEAMDL